MKRILRLILVSILSDALIFLPVVNVNAAEGLALPAGDIIAPEITSSPITKKFAPGEHATITVTVTDNVGVKNVTVFYRNMGAADFKRAEMMRELGTDEYSSTLPEVMVPGMEYYIQATDMAGNIILHGHTFSPLTIAVSPNDAAQEGSDDVSAQQDAPADKPEEKGISKWVWIGLGVLAAGALASGGGGSDGGTTSGKGEVGGTVTITGPAP